MSYTKRAGIETEMETVAGSLDDALQQLALSILQEPAVIFACITCQKVAKTIIRSKLKTATPIRDCKFEFIPE